MPDVDAMSRLQRWLWRAKWVIGSVVVLFLIQWCLAGWSDAWDLLVGRKAPRDASYPYVAWPLSVIGWLVLPALIAGIVAYLITSQADRRRTLTITDMRAAIEARGGPLSVRMQRRYGRDRVRRCERSLADLDLGPLRESFVQPFVRVHEGDVVRADRCWRQCVNDLLNAVAAAEERAATARAILGRGDRCRDLALPRDHLGPPVLRLVHRAALGTGQPSGGEMTKKTAAEIAAEIAWEHVYTRAPQEADEADIRRFADQVAARVAGRTSPGAPLPTLAMHRLQPTHEGDVEEGATYPDPSAAGAKAGDHATVTGEEAADIAADWRSPRETTEAEGARVTTEQLLESVSPEDRLALRRHPDVTDAARALVTAVKLSATSGRDYRSAISLASVLVQRLKHPLEHARRMTFDETPLSFALAAAHGRTNRLTRRIDTLRGAARDRAPVLIPDARLLSEDLSGAIENFISRHGPGLWALEETLDRSRNLARAVFLALLYAYPPQQREARYASPLQENLLELVKLCVDEVRRTVSSVLGREVPLLDEESVKSFLNDFTTSDLRTADLAGADLGGVRWSENETRWPATLDITELKAHSRETPAGSGIYIVEPGTTPAQVLQQTSS